MTQQECICAYCDGKGFSTCGVKCPVHCNRQLKIKLYRRIFDLSGGGQYELTQEVFKLAIDYSEQERQRARNDAINECIELINSYTNKMLEIYNESKKDDLVMLMYDADSRCVATKHLLEKLQSLKTPQQ